MGYPKEIQEAADRALRERRRNAEETAERRRSAFYAACPRAQEIEHALAGTSVAAAKAVLRGGGAAESLRKLKQENQSLQEEYSRLMREHGLRTLEPSYSCPNCRDTGWTDGKMCACRRGLLRSESYRRLNELTPLSLSTFGSFSLEYYSDESDGTRPSERDVMNSTFRFCVRYAQQFTGDSPNLILTGATGLGKTHLSLAIASEAIERGYGVVYVSAGSLVARLEDEHFGRAGGESSLEALRSCDLLILDDLGTEFRSSFSSAAIYNLVNERLLLKKPTIISTNLSTKEMAEFYSERFASRVIGSFRRVVFVGRDVRQRRRPERA